MTQFLILKAQSSDTENTNILKIKTDPDLSPKSLEDIVKLVNEGCTVGFYRVSNVPDQNLTDSRLFIGFIDNGIPDRRYAIWGDVVEGIELVEAQTNLEAPRKFGKIESAERIEEML